MYALNTEGFQTNFYQTADEFLKNNTFLSPVTKVEGYFLICGAQLSGFIGHPRLIQKNYY